MHTIYRGGGGGQWRLYFNPYWVVDQQPSTSSTKKQRTLLFYGQNANFSISSMQHLLQFQSHSIFRHLCGCVETSMFSTSRCWHLPKRCLAVTPNPVHARSGSFPAVHLPQHTNHTRLLFDYITSYPQIHFYFPQVCDSIQRRIHLFLLLGCVF